MSADETIRAVCDLSRGMTRPAFRGQANAKWELRSGGVRRILKAHGPELLSHVSLLQDLVREYHRDELLLPMETMEGKGSSDLQMLCTLQHLGAATGLLDFTESPLVALWFACQQDHDYPDVNGAVFAVDIGNHSVATNGRSHDNPLDLTKLPQELVCYYEPERSLGARVVAQRSVFLIGNPLIPGEHTKKFEIPANLKERVVQALQEMGLSRRALFGDVPGLAAMNGPSVPLAKPLSPRYQKESGNLAYQEQRFDDALLAYQAFAASHAGVAEPHCLLGDTFTALGRYEEAVGAYTEAERHIEVPVPAGPGDLANPVRVGRLMLRAIYYNRGNVRAALGDHPEAIADFGKAQTLDKLTGVESAAVRFNRANSRFALGDYAEACEDYQAVERLMDSSDALLGMGNCQVMIGKFDLALKYFEQGAAEGGSTSESCQRNAQHTQEVLAVVEGRAYDVVRRGRNLDVLVLGLPAGTLGLPVFVGHKGNVGNTPSTMRNAPGGEGYDGAQGFVVRFVEKRGSENDEPAS